jgi:hypothetical protein
MQRPARKYEPPSRAENMAVGAFLIGGNLAFWAVVAYVLGVQLGA